jgi:homoaconitate hydratase
LLSALSEFIGGFPSRIEGECVLCLDDNINTDGIYPGKYTYREDISDQEQAKVWTSVQSNPGLIGS